MLSGSQRLIILIAGPYRSGTNGDPVKMTSNLHALEEHALAVYRLGHLPLIRSLYFRCGIGPIRFRVFIHFFPPCLTTQRRLSGSGV